MNKEIWEEVNQIMTLADLHDVYNILNQRYHISRKENIGKSEWDGWCKCGHLHSEHHSIKSHNYSAGRCTVGECRCAHFVNDLSQTALASMWNGDRKQNQKTTLEEKVKRHVITQIWGFPDEQEEDSLSDRLKAELKDYVETVNHFSSGLVSALKSVAEDEMFEELDWRTRENVWQSLKS